MPVTSTCYRRDAVWIRRGLSLTWVVSTVAGTTKWRTSGERNSGFDLPQPSFENVAFVVYPCKRETVFLPASCLQRQSLGLLRLRETFCPLPTNILVKRTYKVSEDIVTVYAIVRAELTCSN